MRKNVVVRMLKDDSGATAIEYGLIVALVSMAAITAYTALGTSISNFFDGVADTLDNNVPAAN